ncbi:MAG TPA: ATP-binding cassette domain-containing protein [Paracoccaceae bacterium]|nr:ATP-binding cassette domain-containing protein [Paracoccaceae bacterium]
MIEVAGLAKSLAPCNQRGAVLAVLVGAVPAVAAGASGAGKSTLMRMIQGNCRADAGSIRSAGTELVDAGPRTVTALRRGTLGHVRPFLRVVPRVPAEEMVAGPLLALGLPRSEALDRAAAMLARLNLPRGLRALSPATFSGGERQCVTIARGFVHPLPARRPDEPTAGPDADNREVAPRLIVKARARGAAVLGIVHDERARSRVCDRLPDAAESAPRTRAA